MDTKVIDIIGSAKLFAFNVIQIICAQLAILAALVMAPVLYVTVPFYVVAHYPGANLGVFAIAYLFFGPCASALWMALVTRYWNAFVAARQGRIEEWKAENPLVKGIFKCAGWMILGFIGTCIAEFVLLTVFGFVHTQAEYYRFFAAGPFFVFAPELLVILVRVIRRIGQDQQDAHYESLRYAKQYVIDANRHEEKQADAIWLQNLGVQG